MHAPGCPSLLQAIYHKDPPTMPGHHHDWVHGGSIHTGGMSRIDSYSSTEPLSPDSMFTLISSWCVFLPKPS